jgi:general secretion pathway protein E
MKRRLFGLLLREGIVTEKQLNECLELERETGDSFDKILKERGFISEEKLLEIFHRLTGMPYRRNLAHVQVPDSFIERVPAQFARSYNLVSVGKQDGIYKIATCDPLNIFPMDELSALLEAECDPVLAPKPEITALINRAYQRSVDGVEEMLEGIDDDDIINITEDFEAGAEDVLDIANKAPIIRLVNSIIFEAIKMRASDIHFQPFEEKVQCRYRIDGILYDMKVIPKKVQEAITSRIKVMGRMDIAERRLPQDGRTTVRVGDGEVDLRISSVPTSHGERIVLRLLDKSQKVFTLEEIGLTQENYDLINSLIHYSHGIILVTGPTGSGKTTTLYAAMSKINSPEKNIITIEDPIEYHLKGISQIQVSSKKGLTFAAGLRSLLRQDPDIMMVGEIRDVETARIAIQSALTGHLVFSTLHTNDSSSAVTRLLDIGIEPYLVASSVIAVIAQRLVRLICDDCKSEFTPADQDLEELGISRDDLGSDVLYVGMGCPKCLETGYLHRTAIYEILPINEIIRDQIMQRCGATVIKQKAVETGLQTLRMDGSQKVLQGLTTIEEVLRVTQMDLF